MHKFKTIIKKIKTDAESYLIVSRLNRNLYWQILDIVIRILSLLLFPFLYTVLFLIKPFKKIKIGFLFNRRLGHLAVNTDWFLRNQKLKQENDNYYYLFFAYKPANEQLVKMFQRELNIINNEWLSKLFSPIGFFNTQFSQPLLIDGSSEAFEFSNIDSLLTFTKEENNLGKSELLKMGIKENDWYVCIFARDDRYSKEEFHNIDHSSTDHRNGDIDSYTSAVKYIIEQGGFVIRMGYKVSKRFGYQHKKVIDYAVDYRSDFMDIYLAANCRLFIGTSAGGSDVHYVFDTPFVGVNFVPIGTAPYGKNDIYIPKSLQYKKTGKTVPFEVQIKTMKDQIVSFGISPEDTIDNYGMELIDNTPDQILNVVKERMDRLNNVWKDDYAHKEKLDDLNSILDENNHWSRGFRHNIGSDYLVKMDLREKITT